MSFDGGDSDEIMSLRRPILIREGWRGPGEDMLLFYPHLISHYRDMDRDRKRDGNRDDRLSFYSTKFKDT